MEPTTIEEILTPREAAALLRIHRTTLYELARSGDLPAFRVGKDWRFRRDALLAWAARGGSRRVTP